MISQIIVTAMRIRLIKAHLKQIFVCGALVYGLLFLLGEDEKPQVSIVERYKEYRKKEIGSKNTNKAGESNELTLEDIERKNGKAYEREKCE